MTTTAHDLAEAFRRLVAALAWLDDQPDGPGKATGHRHRVAAHFTQLSDGLAGRSAKCPDHPGHVAHNCGPCRSERIGRDPDTPSLPELDDDIREAERRRLGEEVEQ